MTVPLFAQTTVLYERGFDTSWTDEDAQKWSVPVTGHDDYITEYLPGYGLHTGTKDMTTLLTTSIMCSDTITPVSQSNGILDIEADWFPYGGTGGTYAQGNWSYFKVGNVALMHNSNENDCEFAVSVNDMATYDRQLVQDADGLTYKYSDWGGRIGYSTLSSPFVHIKMRIDMPHNKLVYLYLSRSDNPNSVYAALTWENMDIVSPDWSHVVIQSGFHRGRRLGTPINLFLRSIKVTESQQEGVPADYEVIYKYKGPDGFTHNVAGVGEILSGFQNETIHLKDTLWRQDPCNNNAITKFYVIDPEDVVLTNSKDDGRNRFIFYVRLAEKYNYKVVAPELDNMIVDEDSVIEGETNPKLHWNKFIKYNDSWYETQAPFTWTPSYQQNQEMPIYFTKSDISYFWDTDDVFVHLARSYGYDLFYEDANCSDGSTKRHVNWDPVWFCKGVIPDGGVYEVQIPYWNQHTADSYIELDTYKDSIPDNDTTYTAGSIAREWVYDYDPGVMAYGSSNSYGMSTKGICTIPGLEIPLNSGLILRWASTWNSNAFLDYVTFKWVDYLRTPLNMSVKRDYWDEAKQVNMKSFICDRNYIFSECEGITAYYLDSIYAEEDSLGEAKIYAKFEPIIGPTPIGTLCVLVGDMGKTYYVPYVNHSEALPEPKKRTFTENNTLTEWTMKLENSTSSPQADNDDFNYYCLAEYDPTNDPGNVKFCRMKTTGNSTIIDATSVYFKIPKQFFTTQGLSKAKFACIFDNSEYVADATDVKSTTVSTSKKPVATYNLLGQRVTATTKGLVVRNGKKYYNK